MSASPSSRFREQLINASGFVLSFELVPGRSSRGRPLQRVMEFAERAGDEQLLDALTLTDNPGGNPSLSPDVLGHEIADHGVETVIHVTCRDAKPRVRPQGLLGASPAR